MSDYKAGDLSKLLAASSPTAVAVGNIFEKTNKKNTTLHSLDRLTEKRMIEKNNKGMKKRKKKKNDKKHKTEECGNTNEERHTKKKRKKSTGVQRRLERKALKHNPAEEFVLKRLKKKTEHKKTKENSSKAKLTVKSEEKLETVSLKNVKHKRNEKQFDALTQKVIQDRESSDSDISDSDDEKDSETVEMDNLDSDEMSDAFNNNSDEDTDEETEEGEAASVSADVSRDKVTYSSPGFSPPAGIVHESLLKEKGKRKSAESDSDEEEVPKKKAKTETSGTTTNKGTRPRKDRLEKAKNERTIYVGNLPVEMNKKQLLTLFSEFGKVETARFRCVPVNDPTLPKKVIAIKKEFHPERHNLSAFVCFEDKTSAQKATTMNGKEVNGLHIRVDMADKNKEHDLKTSVFVGNLPYDIEEETLRKHFVDCGDIGYVRLIRDKRTCLGKGFGYVGFKEADAVSFALRLNESKLSGRKIRVEASTQKSKEKGKRNKKEKSKVFPRSNVTDDSGVDKKRKLGKKIKRVQTPSNTSKSPFQGIKSHAEQKRQQKFNKSSPRKDMQSTGNIQGIFDKRHTEKAQGIQKDRNNPKKFNRNNSDFSKKSGLDHGSHPKARYIKGSSDSINKHSGFTKKNFGGDNIQTISRPSNKNTNKHIKFTD